MRTLVALAGVLAMMMGWSDAEAAEARITSFVFGCDTPHGRKLKPKFGDIDEAFYTDLPAQRQQCLDAVQRKISLCRDNTLFESNTKNEKYAGCLPVFEEQAEVCVKHFERERGKCGAGAPAPAEVATLDASERQRVQAALSAERFDPGPPGGKFGPRTRQAIAAWQQANGYAPTGTLTEDQAEALLADAAPLEPFGPNWSIVENQPCQVWNYGKPEEFGPFTWSGACIDGKASGEGRLTFSSGEFQYQGGMRNGKTHGEGTVTHVNGFRHEGGWRDGKEHGHGKVVYSDGGRYEGEWRDGKRHGRGAYTYSDGGRYEGGWRDGKRHGRGAYTYSDGSRYEGEWRDGNPRGRGTRTWADGNLLTCKWFTRADGKGECEPGTRRWH